MAPLNGIHPQSLLAMELARKPSMDIQEFMETVAEFINGEKTIRTSTAAKGSQRKKIPKLVCHQKGSHSVERTKEGNQALGVNLISPL